jgi:hypothetical protein
VRLGVGVAVLAAGVCFAPAALADERVTELVSTGPAGGNGSSGIYSGDGTYLCDGSVKVSENGQRAFFHSAEQLTSDDADSDWDVYMRSGGTTTLISQGPQAGVGSAVLCDISVDGSRAVFKTTGQLVAADTDSQVDVYERDGSSTLLVSSGPAGGNGAFEAIYNGVSADGSRVFFLSQEQLVAADSDAWMDVYERSGDTTTLLTPGPPPPSCGIYCPSSFEQLSPDGSRIYVITSKALVPGDNDNAPDVYERTASGFTLVSAGPPGAQGYEVDDPYLSFDGASPDGARVYFTTSDNLDPADSDGSDDLYERSGGVTRLVAPPAAVPCDNSCIPDSRSFFDEVTADGQGVFFYSAERLTADDDDGGFDTYERRGNTVTLITPGGGPDCRYCGSGVAAQSSDGSRLLIGTDQPLIVSDADGVGDLYERAGGSFTLVSTGPGDDGTAAGGFNAASPDLERVVFGSGGALTADDVDPPDGCYYEDDGDYVFVNCSDVYLREGGTTTLISKGPLGAAGAFGAGAVEASKDARIIYFVTGEQLTPDDTDDQLDVYVSRPADTTEFVRPMGATPMYLSLVPAYKPCTAPNRTHGPRLGFPSCNPPAPGSPNLTVGVGGGSPALARSVGSVRLGVLAADVQLTFSLTNVMKVSDLSEYTGELRAHIAARLTDKEGAVSSTTEGFPLSWSVPCSTTPDPQLASACALDTTLDAIVPGSTAEGTGAIWGLDKLKVFDGGPDGDADSEADNSLFATQGVFVP